MQTLLLHKSAPSFGQHITLATVPVRIPEPPRFSISILEIHQNSITAAVMIILKMFLGMLLRDHQPVQLSNIARRHGFLEKLLPLNQADKAVMMFNGARFTFESLPFIMQQLVAVGMFTQHVDDVGLGVEVEELELGDVGVGGFGQWFEVGDGVAATEALGGDVVRSGGVGFEVKGAEPDALVLLVDLGAPAAVGLWDDAFVLGGWEFPVINFIGGAFGFYAAFVATEARQFLSCHVLRRMFCMG